MSKNDKKTRYTDDELEEFRVLLQEKLDNAKEQMLFYRTQMDELANSDDAKSKGLDDSISSAEKERLTNLTGRQQKYIQHLENALLRIQNKVYGVCRNSGELISKERLRAVPHATLSIAAKQKKK